MAQCNKCKLNSDCQRIWKSSRNQNTCCVSFTPIVTNGDRIRAMTDEELAELLNRHNFCAHNFDCEKWKRPCGECNLDWLREEGE